MTDNFLEKVDKITDKGLKGLRIWEKKEAGKEFLREYLSEEGRAGKSRIDNLLNRIEEIALDSENEENSIKAAKSLLDIAVGTEKITNIQKNESTEVNFVNK